MTTASESVKPCSGLSIDLDNEWTYLKTHGDTAWTEYPSYLHVVVPRILSLLSELGQETTFFIVGRDAGFEKNHDLLSTIVAAGHEVGNHSHDHNPWLHRYSAAKFEEDVSVAEEEIELATGVRPRAFRGPGYSMSNQALMILARRGYLYDSSTLPTFLGPLARRYYLMTTSLDARKTKERELLFGSFRDGLRPLKPYRWQTETSTLLEIPVTTYPLFRIPFHFSYILYISSFSPALALLYWRTALYMCHLSRIDPVLLLHPLDLLGCDDVKSLSFFPGMNLRSEVKLERIRQYLTDLQADYRVLPMGKYSEVLKSHTALKTRLPDFQSA